MQILKERTINSIVDYITIVDEISKKDNSFILFRGQSSALPLLPSIARRNNSINTTETEKMMLSELKRRGSLLLKTNNNSDLDLLVMAQHFGMKTRLLDWSSNPLTALWFAISNEYAIKDDSFVYVFYGNKSFIAEQNTDPFGISKTKIIRPPMNNERIIAQDGWFTIHFFSQKTNSFVPLEKNRELKNNIERIKIPSAIKMDLLKHLSRLGTNSRTIFPDISGLCQHLNWKYLIK